MDISCNGTSYIAKTRHASAINAVQLPDMPIKIVFRTLLKTSIATSGVDESCLLYSTATGKYIGCLLVQVVPAECGGEAGDYQRRYRTPH